MQYDEYRPRESQISLGQFIRVMVGYNRKSLLRFLIVTVSVWIVGFLGIFFIYNNFKADYVTNWSYVISTFDGASYIDGTQFYYPDLVNIETLESVKESNPDFKNINVEKLVTKDAITIKKNAVADDSIYKFTITAKKSYFASEAQAREFIDAVVKVPAKKVTELVELIDNTLYLRQFKDYAVSYDDLVTALQKQGDLLFEGYDSLLTNYGNRYVTTEDNVTYRLNDLIIRVKSEINNMNLAGLNEIVANNSYVYNYEQQLPRLKTTLQTYESDLELINNKITVFQQEIDRQINLGASSVTIEALNTTLAGLLVERENINRNVEIVQDQINLGAFQDTTEFDAMLESYYQTLSTLTKEYTFVQKALHLSYQKIFYSTNKIVEEVGGMGLLSSLVLPLLLGLVVAVIVNIAKDLKKFTDEEKAKKDATKNLDANKE